MAYVFNPSKGDPMSYDPHRVISLMALLAKDVPPEDILEELAKTIGNTGVLDDVMEAAAQAYTIALQERVVYAAVEFSDVLHRLRLCVFDENRLRILGIIVRNSPKFLSTKQAKMVVETFDKDTNKVSAIRTIESRIGDHTFKALIASLR